EAFKRSLEKENMSLEKFKTEVKNQVIVRKLIQREILPDILLKEEDLKKYYQAHSSLFGIPEKRSIKQILFPVGSESLENQKKLADRLYTMLRGGKSPEEAKEADFTLRGAFKESDIGAFKKGELLPEIDRVVFSLDPGLWSSPLATAQGIHLFKTDIKEGALRPFEEVKEEIKERIFQEQTETAIANWMANLRKSATIELVIFKNNVENAPRAKHEK
ncbi:MAG TPA: peptidyl-prolyl cis-trans isomerase, partial [Nitrospiria bacterium]|nr:peptidyl-prolyl cis-trans isomerase [Nitrospiria bacterium]